MSLSKEAVVTKSASFCTEQYTNGVKNSIYQVLRYFAPVTEPCVVMQFFALSECVFDQDFIQQWEQISEETLIWAAKEIFSVGFPLYFLASLERKTQNIAENTRECDGADKLQKLGGRIFWSWLGC